MAVQTGMAEVVVCYRAFNERSGHRFGQVQTAAAANIDNSWSYPMGLGTPAAMVAMFARRYMHEYGATSEDFGRVAVIDRKHAATNPARVVPQPADHPRRPPVVALDRRTAPAPRLLPGERRRRRARRHLAPNAPAHLPQKPAIVKAAAQGSGTDQFTMTSYYRDDLTGLPEMGVVAQRPVEAVGHRSVRCGRRRALRPLHAVRARPTGGAGLLRQGRGTPLRRGRQPGAGRQAAAQPARRPARRGLPARHERHRRGGAAGPRHRGQPGRRT